MSALSLLLVAGLLGSPVLAKSPTANIAGSATAQPNPVSAGGLVRFDVEFTNSSSSNYSSFFVDATTASDSELVAVFNEVGGSCDAGTDLHCDFSPLNAGETVSFSVVYLVPADATNTWSQDFLASSNGSTSKDTPHQSHGDSVTVTGTVQIGTGDTGGSYIYGNTLSSQDDQTLSKHNPQAAKQEYSSAFGNGFAVTESEVDGSVFECPTALANACFGQWFLISQTYGDTVPGGFTLYLSYYKISGNPDNVNFVHLYDSTGDGVYDAYEEIPSFNDDPCSSSNPMNCVQDVTSSQGGATFTLLVDHTSPYGAW